MGFLFIFSLIGIPIQAAAKTSDPVQSNRDSNWPHATQVDASGAVLMDADTGAVLYGQNPDKKLYPASITKLMTAILAYENLDLDDTVTFSAAAVNGIDRDSSNIGIDVGESLSVYDCLRAMIISSANEVALGLAEKVSGSETKFAALMNKKAKELGCTNTSFVTPNGLQDTNHYTTAHDMALIAKAYFDIPELAEISDIQSYTIEPSEGQPDEIKLYSSNKFLTGEKQYEGIVGSKTGYTSQARHTLVTCCKRGKMRLIAVVLKEESPSQYDDTIKLFNYGFKNFEHIHVADYETQYSMAGAGFMRQGDDIFGKSAAPFTVSSSDYLTVPNGVKWDDLTSEFVYEDSKDGNKSEDSGARYTANGEKIMGTVSYTYSKTKVGEANLIYSGDVKNAKIQDVVNPATEPSGSTGRVRGFFLRILHRGSNGTWYLDVPFLLFVIILIAAIFIAEEMIRNYILYIRRMRKKNSRNAGNVHKRPHQNEMDHGSAQNRTAKKKKPRY